MELTQILSSEMLDKLESNTLRHYQDIQNEGGPVAEEEPEIRSTVAEPSQSLRSTNSADAVNLEPETVDVEMGDPDLEEYSPSLPDLEPVPEVPGPPELPEEASTRVPSVNNSRRPSSSGTLRVDEASSGVIPWGPVRQESAASSAMPYPFVQPPPAWPTAPGRSNYVEVVSDFHQEADGAKYWFNKVHGRGEPRAAAGGRSL